MQFSQMDEFLAKYCTKAGDTLDVNRNVKMIYKIIVCSSKTQAIHNSLNEVTVYALELQRTVFLIKSEA